MPEHLTTLNSSSIAVRIALALSVVTVVVFAWFGVRFQVGDMLSEITTSNEDRSADIAEASVNLSPSNPRSLWLKGSVSRSNFDPASIESSLKSFAEAARLGPFHYRWWTELGRAHERNGDAEAAEKAFLYAVERAPEYTAPRWQLGNFYLRQGRTDRAIEHLSIATAHSALYRGQVYATVWNFYGQDPNVVEQFASDRPE